MSLKRPFVPKTDVTFYYDYVLIRVLTDTITATENEISVKHQNLQKFGPK